MPRHIRRRRASFVLTSLIDVIFLLVIFFMVSSQITPFSIIALGPIAGGQVADAPASPPASAAVAVRVMAGSVRISGRVVAMSGLAAALGGLKESGVTALIVIPTEAATVQDLVLVLEGIKTAGIESATVLNRRGA